MAEICCGLANEMSNTEPREARRKRMQIRKFKLVSGMAGLPENCKRRKFEVALSAASPPCSGNEDTGSDVTESSESSGTGNAIESRSSDVKVAVEIDREVLDFTPKYGVISVCGRRRDMEDAVGIHPLLCRKEDGVGMNLHFFGVFDGHGCSHVAFNCRDRMHQLVKEEIANTGTSPSDWKKIMEQSFTRMDKEVLERGRGNCRCDVQIPRCDAGSTAVVTVVTPEKIVTANCGDSRAVLCRGGRAIPLSSDHKPDRPDELLRIQAAGGRVIYWDGARVQGVLAMSRAIGDEYLRPYVIPDPEVTVTDRTDEDECLILASDGLWDVLTSEMACSIVRMCLHAQGPGYRPATRDGKMAVTSVEEPDRSCSNAALLLTKLAMARNTSDNVSVVVVDLRRNM